MNCFFLSLLLRLGCGAGAEIGLITLRPDLAALAVSCVIVDAGVAFVWYAGLASLMAILWGRHMFLYRSGVVVA